MLVARLVWIYSLHKLDLDFDVNSAICFESLLSGQSSRCRFARQKEKVPAGESRQGLTEIVYQADFFFLFAASTTAMITMMIRMIIATYRRLIPDPDPGSDSEMTKVEYALSPVTKYPWPP